MKNVNTADWAKTASMCEEAYGIYVDWSEEFFICPECQEPIYSDDWGDHESMWKHYCPICEYNYADDFVENGMIDEVE